MEMDQQTQIRRSDCVLIKKKKITCHLVDFAVTANHCVKIKDSEKRDLV